MPDRKRSAGKAIAAAFAAVMVMTVTLSVAPLPLGGQDTRSVITVIYGDGTKLLVRDWNFVYVFLEAEIEAYLGCGKDRPCGISRTAQDLHLVNSFTGSTPPAQEFAIFWKEDLQTIRIRWKTNNLGPYESDGVTLNRNRNAPKYESQGITVLSTRGTEYDFSGGLRAPDAFLSRMKYVYQMNLSVSGTVQDARKPPNFEFSLFGTLAASSPKEQVVEIRFRQ